MVIKCDWSADIDRMRLPPRPRPSTKSPHRGVQRNAALLLVVALFAAIFVASLHDADALEAARLLFVLPIGLAAFGFGTRGGLLAGIIAGALVTAWNAVSGADFGPLAIASWASVFVLVGSMLGWFIDSRRRLEERSTRYSELSLDLFCRIPATMINTTMLTTSCTMRASKPATRAEPPVPVASRLRWR